MLDGINGGSDIGISRRDTIQSGNRPDLRIRSIICESVTFIPALTPKYNGTYCSFSVSSPYRRIRLRLCQGVRGYCCDPKIVNSLNNYLHACG